MTEAELSRVKSANDSSVMDEGESGCIAGPWMPSHVWQKMITTIRLRMVLGCIQLSGRRIRGKTETQVFCEQKSY